MRPVSVYSVLSVMAFGALKLAHEGAAQTEGSTNGTSGKAPCTRLIEMLVLEVTSILPQPRARSNQAPTFSLYTRSNSNQEILRITRNGSVSSNYYDAERNTKFIIHGFLGRGNNRWIENLRNALLEWADVNVIIVDWYRAAQNPYPRAAANAAVIGSRTAKLVHALIGSYGGNAENFHLIGHSLGSHVAAYAGQSINGLGRITGLDPAGPLFSLKEEEHRLDPSDANFVDAIHTDKDCLGLRMPVGHMDFYPNGGNEQPGCGVLEMRTDDDTGIILSALDSSVCSHFRAVKLFTESIRSSPSFIDNDVNSNAKCVFLGELCDSYEEFLEDRCNSNVPDDVKFAVMGIDAIMPAQQNTTVPPPRTYYLLTNPFKPYCTS